MKSSLVINFQFFASKKILLFDKFLDMYVQCDIVRARVPNNEFGKIEKHKNDVIYFPVQRTPLAG